MRPHPDHGHMTWPDRIKGLVWFGLGGYLLVLPPQMPALIHVLALIVFIYLTIDAYRSD